MSPMLRAGLGLLMASIAGSAFAAAASGVVISQFTTRGPTGGNDEFVEIHNAGSSDINIGGWVLQGCSSGSPGTASARATIPAGTVLASGRYYLFSNAGSAPNYSYGVAADQTYTSGYTDFTSTNYSGIQLVNGSGVKQDGVGGGLSPCREGTGITTPASNGTSNVFLRRLDGTTVQDDNNNAVDFPAASTVNGPRNSSSPANVPGGGGGNSPSFSIDSVTLAEGNSSTTAFVFTVTLNNPNGTASSVTVDTSNGTATAGVDYSAVVAQTLNFSGTPSGTAQTQTVTVYVNGDTDSEPNETFNVTLSAPGNATLATATGIGTITNDDAAAASARIYQIQGANHNSPLVGTTVTNVPGIVTAVSNNSSSGRGFYMQDASGDGNPNTSDGIFVFTSSTPTVAVGDAVAVSGTVQEFRQITSGTACEGSVASGPCLRTTEISSPSITVLSHNNTLPAPTVIGTGGRIIPNSAIYSGSTQVSVEDSSYPFDASANAIDFFETLEGMRVQVNNSRVVSPTSTFSSGSEFWVVPDQFANSNDQPNLDGGLTVTGYADPQPERVQIDSGLFGSPQQVTVGDSVPGAIVGVLGNSFANYELLYTQSFSVVSGGLQKQSSTLAAGDASHLTVAAYNVENLGGTDAQSRFDTVGSEIVNRLQSPDILSVSEVQDNNGSTNDGTVDATTTINKIIAAVVAAGGPSYSYKSINPVDGQDGGEPGGNIRVVFFYNPARVSFVPGTQGAGSATLATAATQASGALALTYSPGRLLPTDSAFNSSRKPLAATFDFNGQRVVIIGNHFNSKGGDTPAFGRVQPPTRSSETQRHAQATIVYDFVSSLQSVDPKARVIVLGDLNDYGFSDTLSILRSGNADVGAGTVRLYNLGEELVTPARERHSYVYQGVSQELDHLLVSQPLLGGAQFQAVRFNSEFSDQTSDHDPLLARVSVTPPDSTPDDFLCTAITGAETSVSVAFAPIVVSGIDTPAAISVSNGSYSVNGGAASATVNNGDSIVVSSLSAPDYASTVSATLNIGGKTADCSVTTRDADRTPEAYSFAPQTGVEPGTAYVSEAATITGIDKDTPVTIVGGEYSINGGSYTSDEGKIEAGASIRVRLTSATMFAVSTSATLNVGTGSASFQLTTRDVDQTPAPLSFPPVLDAALGTVYTSAPATISGIDEGTPISVSGGLVSINGGTFTNTVGVVNNGDQVRLQLTSATLNSTKVSAVLTVGTVSASFDVTTTAADDTTPDAIVFNTLSNVELSTSYVSNAVTISGLSVAVPIKVSGGTYSLNGAAYTTAAGTARNGDVVRVQLMSSSAYATKTTAKLTVGSAKASFSVTTRAADTTPDTLVFNSITKAELATLYTSNTVSIGGVEIPVAISIDAGSYSINGAAYTSAPGTVQNGDQVTVQLQSSASYSTKTVATLTVGKGKGKFSITTRKAP